MQYGRRCGVCVCAGRFAYDIFLVATPTRDGMRRLPRRARERDGRPGRPNSLFCANTSREAHVESHTNINHIYCLTKLFRRKRTADATSGVCRRRFSRLASRDRFRRGSLAQRDQSANRSSHCYQIKPHPPTRRFRNDSPHSPPASTRSFFTVETRVGSLNFWQSDKPFTLANTSFSPE